MAEASVVFTAGANSTPPDGTEVAVDNIADKEYQYIKLVDGTPGSTQKVQATEANGLEVDVTRVQNDTASGFDHGAKSSIGTSAVQLTASSVPATRGVLVKAANANAGTVYVGNSDVTNGSVDATDGFELGAGESVLVKVSNANLVYVIGSGAGQKVFWMTV